MKNPIICKIEFFDGEVKKEKLLLSKTLQAKDVKPYRSYEKRDNGKGGNTYKQKGEATKIIFADMDTVKQYPDENGKILKLTVALIKGIASVFDRTKQVKTVEDIKI